MRPPSALTVTNTSSTLTNHHFHPPYHPIFHPSLIQLELFVKQEPVS